jgi:hypothetical protein
MSFEVFIGVSLLRSCIRTSGRAGQSSTAATRIDAVGSGLVDAAFELMRLLPLLRIYAKMRVARL